MSLWPQRTTRLHLWLVLLASGGTVLLLGELANGPPRGGLKGEEPSGFPQSDVPEAPWVAPVVDPEAEAQAFEYPPPVKVSPAPPRQARGHFGQTPQTPWSPRETPIPHAEESPIPNPPSPQGPELSVPLKEGADGASDFVPPVALQQRSMHLERVARQADQHTRRGFELAGRRAYFSARAEFINALRLVAEGLDSEHRTQQHSLALRRGFIALEEADDFISMGSGVREETDLRTVVAGHSTPILREASWEGLTPMVALQRYLTYAQEQLALAAGQEVAGSMALHALGKLYEAMADQPALGLKAAEPKAMAFYQAALLVDPYNFMAANDLGVLLARSGWYEEAQAALLYSLRITPTPVGWRNLAIVYRQMGQYDLALQAALHWRALHQQQIARQQDQAESAGVVVQWVPPERFAVATGEAPWMPDGRLPPKEATSTSRHTEGGASRSEPPTRQSAPPGNPAAPPPAESGSGTILAHLFRGPLSLFREHSQRPEAGASTPSQPSSGREPDRASRPPDASRRTSIP